MTPQSFVEAIKEYVGESAVENTIGNLISPPGRSISPREKEISSWYNKLHRNESEYVNEIISAAVHDALFGFFAVLDGVRTIDEDNGRFELTYMSKQRVVLNNPDDKLLHDIYNAND